MNLNQTYQDKKVVFFTEGPTRIANISRHELNARTDVAWQIALQAHQINIHQQRPLELEYDVAIAIIPKKDRPDFVDLFKIMKASIKSSGKICVMQEGPNDLWQDWPISEQLRYLEFLLAVDIIYCHNNWDSKYYKGLTNGKDVRILPSLMITDTISTLPTTERNGVMIGGNFCSWYGGIDSMIIAQELDLGPMYIPSMGRKQIFEETIEDLIHVPYKSWSEWILELNKRKYAIHLMRTYAAGTFALNCAYLGIPCIGYNSLDTQSICFPQLSVPEGDLETARRLAKHLKENDAFYNHVSAYARKAWRGIYSEEIFLEKFFENI